MSPSLFDELFLGMTESAPQKAPAPLSQKPKQTPKPQPKKQPKKESAKPTKPLQEGEGSDVCAVPHPTDDVYAIKTEETKDVLLQNVERACGGNRYLESMVIGEILNSPRFKEKHKR